MKMLNDDTRLRLSDIKLALEVLKASDELHTAAQEVPCETVNECNRKQRLLDDLGDLGCRLCEVLNEETHRFLEATE